MCVHVCVCACAHVSVCVPMRKRVRVCVCVCVCVSFTLLLNTHMTHLMMGSILLHSAVHTLARNCNQCFGASVLTKVVILALASL